MILSRYLYVKRGVFATLMVLMATCRIAFSQSGNGNDSMDIWQIDTLLHPVPINEQLFVEKINNNIHKLDARDGSVDRFIYFVDSAKSQVVTDAVFKQAPMLVINIQNLPADHFKKLQYLRDLEGILNGFRTKNWVGLSPEYFKKVLANFKEFMQAEQTGSVIAFAQQHADLYMLDNINLLDDYAEARNYVYETLGSAYPDRMIKSLSKFADEPFACTIIAAAARTQPNTIMNYALSTGKLGKVVRSCDDELVKTISRIAKESNNPLRLLPFINQIYNGAETIQALDSIAADDVAYYKALVALKLNNDTLGAKVIDAEVQYRALKFIRTINELHESADAVRFRSIEPFNAEELYFMMIGGQDEIYTSSFINGTFRRMMNKMKPKDGNALLEKVHRNHFRTFIRMCAGFNTLQQFLSTFKDEDKNNLMKDFVAGLEKGSADDLEDAVDVADAYGSITDEGMLSFLKKEVKMNYEKCYGENSYKNSKGVIVYGLLNTIFNNDNGTSLNAIIPPITYVPYSSLIDGDNGVVEQVFFYGDRSGMGTYNNFLNQYRNSKWKIQSPNRYWTVIASTGKNKVSIYMNVPLPEEKGEDDEAQRQLRDYMIDNNINPTIIVHRGHSYYLPVTISYMVPSAKVIMLGSCGGYHNLKEVLDRSPDANIIASKQIGALRVNVPIINEINEYAYEGKDMDWVTMWKRLSKRFSGSGAVTQDLFSDYVPPYKNLGAIFIKAYRKIADNYMMD